MLKLNAAQLRKADQLKISPPAGGWKLKIKRSDIYIILDNVLDTYNIGSIFRLADAVAAKKVFLCGGTEIPPNHRIKKASINTTEWVTWTYKQAATSAVHELKNQNSKVKVVAIEQTGKSVPYDEYEYKFPIAFVVGNETTGVSKEVLKNCDAVVELPMFGVNISLNVMVSLGIVLYQALEGQGLSRSDGNAKYTSR